MEEDQPYDYAQQVRENKDRPPLQIGSITCHWIPEDLKWHYEDTSISVSICIQPWHLPLSVRLSKGYERYYYLPECFLANSSKGLDLSDRSTSSVKTHTDLMVHFGYCLTAESAVNSVLESMSSVRDKLLSIIGHD